MKICAVIAEYNPFHNAHKQHLELTRKLTGCEGIACIMSGNFVQRGEPAITDKHARTLMALAGGADLVIELPAVFALSSANRFAYGGVYLANALGCVDALSFGSECGNIEALSKVASLQLNESDELSCLIKQYLSDGLSHATAVTEAFSKLYGTDKNLLSQPNNILAVEYLKALKQLNSTIEPITVKRFKTEHDSLDTCGNFASASALRKMLKSGQDITSYLPDAAQDIFADATQDGLVFPDMLGNLLLYTLRKTAITHPDMSYLKNINDVTEGLENRILKASFKDVSFEELADAVSSKRYTVARIKRILCSVLLNITKDMAKKNPSYIRVLGFNQTGQKMLSVIGETARLPVITKAADYEKACDDDIFKTDILSGDVYALLRNKKPLRASRGDYRNFPVIFK